MRYIDEHVERLRENETGSMASAGIVDRCASTRGYVGVRSTGIVGRMSGITHC